MLEIVKSCGNQMLSNLVLKVAVISSRLVYFKNGDSRKSEPEHYICSSSSVCKSSLTSLKVAGNAQQYHPQEGSKAFFLTCCPGELSWCLFYQG